MPRLDRRVAFVVFVFVGVAVLSACGRGAAPPTPDGARQVGSQPGLLRDRLAQYSLNELEQILRERTQKAVYPSEKQDTKNIPTTIIIDEIRFRQKSVYGSDRRRDYYAIAHPDMLQAAGGVVAFVKPAAFRLSSTRLSLVAKTLGETQNLCSGEAFAEQPSASYCTGFVVGRDLIATAGHCVQPDWKSIRLVFGYRVEVVGSTRRVVTELPLEDVYTPIEIISQKVDAGTGEDYAVLRVDRPILNHARLKLALTRHGSRKDTAVYAIGYPSGLPLKLADEAIVRAETDHTFLTNTDTFGGNSGSPILDAVSHEVIGILGRGDVDYKTRNYCQVAFVCPPNGCSGEGCTWLSVVTGISDITKSVADATPKNAEAAEPIVRTFSSGPRLSGSGSSFSREYQLTSDPAPPGYRIGKADYSLSGDRACGNWATCRVSEQGESAVLRFTLQGHNEWPPPGQALSEGHLVVTYVPIK